MDGREMGKLREIVFERLVSGETSEELYAQLSGQIDKVGAGRLIAEARERIDQGGESAEFARSVRKIRKRRLVGARYLAWKILARILIFMGLASTLAAMLSGGKLVGSFGGLLVGGIILAVVEWREHLRINPHVDQPGNG